VIWWEGKSVEKVTDDGNLTAFVIRYRYRCSLIQCSEAGVSWNKGVIKATINCTILLLYEPMLTEVKFVDEFSLHYTRLLRYSL
jgi:hypothetical protein